MSKGRNSQGFYIRLPDSIVIALQEKASKAGCASVGQYVKSQIMKSLDKPVSDSTITKANHSAITIDQGNHSACTTDEAPLYNPAVHRPGDRVRVLRYGRARVITIPELDADGQIVPNLT